MGAVIVAGLALLAIAFLAVFFVELCKEKRRTRVKLILTTADGEASGKIRSNLLVLPSRRTASPTTPILVRNVQRRTK